MIKDIKEKRVSCKICGRLFRNVHIYWGHLKIHNKDSIENIRKSKLGNQNPAKRLDVRIKISESARGRIPWNKNKRWIKDKKHNKIVERFAENLKNNGLKIITTHNYVPDAIVIDFNNKTVKAFELNPGSILSKGLRAKEKNYNSLIVKVRRNKKYKHKNMDREIPINEF